MISQLVSYIKEQDSKFIFLALMLVFLPSFEVPKNIFALLFVVSWIFISRRDKNWGGKWRAIDSIFLFWILADIIVGINAVIIHDMPANGSKDIVKYILVAWALSRSGFSSIKIIRLCLIVAVFSVIPLIYSYSNCNGGVCVELNSVGHVNHTAIYLLIAYVVSLSMLVFNYSNLNYFHRVTFLVSSLLLAYVIVDTHSRAASGLLTFITLFAMVYSIYFYRNLLSVLISIISLISILFLLTQYPPMVLDKFFNGSSLVGESPRQKIRNFSYYVYKANPFLGIGFGNFSNLDHKYIKEDVIKEKGKYDENKFMPYAHPHNVFYNYLIGGGVVAFSIFVWFWLQIVNIIYRVNKQSNEKWIVFSGISVTMIVLGIGWVNTTLAHEHALITMFVLGLLISLDRKIHAG
jgi:hypothetical protein